MPGCVLIIFSRRGTLAYFAPRCPWYLCSASLCAPNAADAAVSVHAHFFIRLTLFILAVMALPSSSEREVHKNERGERDETPLFRCRAPSASLGCIHAWAASPRTAGRSASGSEGDKEKQHNETNKELLNRREDEKG